MVYWCAPIIGMIVAMRAYDILRGVGKTANEEVVLGVEGPLQSMKLPATDGADTIS